MIVRPFYQFPGILHQPIDVFTTSDSYAEFLSAGRILIQHKLAASCFVSLPIIQTALALRTLVRLGHESHPFVNRTFNGLLAIQTKAKDFGVDLGDVPLGFWCAHQCRFKLEEEKARRLAQKTGCRC
jgi:hypothetical protein